MLKNMQTESSDDKTERLETLENDFLKGDLGKLKRRACPVCGEKGTLSFSVAKRPENLLAVAGRRFSAGISIYCTGSCNQMISHLDGFCPAWAEHIEDWAAFSEECGR